LRVVLAAAMRRPSTSWCAAFTGLSIAFCWRLLRSPDAEDLAQDTFVRAFVHFERFDPERPVLPWLIAIARRLCLDVLRRRKMMTRVETMRSLAADVVYMERTTPTTATSASSANRPMETGIHPRLCCGERPCFAD
jgi:RNA polymerase sigma factor (sigma-70 family)